MTIHVVQAGETINSIASQYDVSENLIIRNNGLTNPDQLVIGQTIVILYPNEVYTVQEGDTLQLIGERFSTNTLELLRNNPYIINNPILYPGQEIVINYNQAKIGPLVVDGYVYEYVNRDVLREALPYLTYLTLFSYGFTADGELIGIDDDELIFLAKSYQTAPVMLISTINEFGSFSDENLKIMFYDLDIQNRLISNIIDNMNRKGYVGLNIDFEFIPPEDKDAYISFISNTTEQLNANGYFTITDLAPKVSRDQPGLLYESHDYGTIGSISNLVFLMTYEWGYTYGPPMAVAPLNKVREVLDYAITEIPVSKILMGIPNYAYDWKLPYVRGESRADSIGNEQAVDIARRFGAEIQYDELSQSPFFYYYNEGVEHVVWFEDANSINAKLRLVAEYGFQGIGYWNLMRPFRQNWLVLNSMFDIVKTI